MIRKDKNGPCHQISTKVQVEEQTKLQLRNLQVKVCFLKSREAIQVK